MWVTLSLLASVSLFYIVIIIGPIANLFWLDDQLASDVFVDGKFTSKTVFFCVMAF